jgi:menaquinone-9 beta-reductase
VKTFGQHLFQIHMDERADVMVVGGGPAGASAAIRLSLAGARVVLVERERFPRAKLCGEFISPECLAHFARLGVKENMLAAGAREVGETVFYTRAGRSAVVPSEWFAGRGAAALGLSRAEMDEQLLRRARAVGVEVLEETRAVGLLYEGGRVRGVKLKRDGDEATPLERRALVTLDATGRARSLARMLERERGARGARGRAALVAFKAHLEGARGSTAACEIYFYGGGYGGLSPVEGGLSNLCFIASARDVRARGGDPERVLREVVQTNARARETLGRARAASAWLSVALERFGRGEVAPARGLLAVGDAASFIDPFTGSGMLMALESGALAASTVARHLTTLGDGAQLRESYDGLARDYGAAYESRFASRLRLCSWLRRAAFAPPALAETAVLMLGANASARRLLARATRQSARASLDRFTD